MAAAHRILMDVNTKLSRLIYDERNETEFNRINEILAAERAVVLNGKQRRAQAATIIQRHWRGYMCRRVYVHNLLKHFREISLRHYDSMIIKIQKVWRGHYIRRHVFDFYRRRKYLEALVEKNKLTVAHIRELSKEREREECKKARIIEQEFQNKLRRKFHYFLSTKSIPGIFNSPYRPNDNRDMFLKSAGSCKSPPSKKRRQHVGATRADKIWDSLKNLPNVPPKLQGPFRDPREVQFQRYKPLRQTLRVDTDFYHLEKARKILKDDEWTRRHHDDRFMLVKNKGPINLGNVVHRFSRYTPLEQRILRLEDSSLNIDEKAFKLTLSPIPLFDVYEEKMKDIELMKFREQSKLNN